MCKASLGAVKSRACCGEWRRREEEGEGSEERHLDDYDLSLQEEGGKSLSVLTQGEVGVVEEWDLE